MDEYDNPPCPACDGDGVYLGALGRAQWFQCRCCGWQFRSNEE
jgi:tRNA(Ile2) C34 agmatinyltransferase TiaS